MPATPKEPFAWKSFLTHLSTFSVVVLGLGLLAGAFAGLRPLEARAAAYHPTSAARLSIAWPRNKDTRNGTWMPRDEQERLLRLGQDAASDDDSPYSADALERISRAMAATGWFDGYPSVYRGEGGYVVQGRWRVPAAVVRHGGKDRLLSWEAMPLPMTYPEGRSMLPAIIGPAQGMVNLENGRPDLHAAWPGEDVGAALEMLRTVNEQAWGGQVAGVDVSRFAAEGSILLVTRGGNRIVWGGRPSKPRLGEVGTPQKLIHLAQLKRDFGSIDAGYPLIYVNTDRLQFDTTASATDAARGQSEGSDQN